MPTGRKFSAPTNPPLIWPIPPLSKTGASLTLRRKSNNEITHKSQLAHAGHFLCSYKHTGRPYQGNYTEPASDRIYLSKYRDVKTDALYPFGFWLSYTTFSYADIRLSKSKIGMNETLIVTVGVINTGKYAGEEVVQRYIRDLVGSITRPVKELKGFQKLSFQPGEKKTVTFTVCKNDLAFWHEGQGFVAEPGLFKVFVGGNSWDVGEMGFELGK